MTPVYKLMLWSPLLLIAAHGFTISPFQAINNNDCFKGTDLKPDGVFFYTKNGNFDLDFKDGNLHHGILPDHILVAVFTEGQKVHHSASSQEASIIVFEGSEVVVAMHVSHSNRIDEMREWLCSNSCTKTEFIEMAATEGLGLMEAKIEAKRWCSVRPPAYSLSRILIIIMGLSLISFLIYYHETKPKPGIKYCAEYLEDGRIFCDTIRQMDVPTGVGIEDFLDQCMARMNVTWISRETSKDVSRSSYC